MLQIRWHGRAGQGAVTGSKGLAKVFFKIGKQVQAFAFYGSAKRGASMTAYNRISDTPIINHEKAMSPDYVFVIDQDLIDTDDILVSVKKETKYILSTHLSKEQILEIQPKLKDKEVYIIDCISIAKDTIGRPIPNTPMLGAFMKISHELDLEEFKNIMRKDVLKVFPDNIIEANLKSIDRAYAEVK
ncbi:Pyruvate:ferredoxin oxidoreductase, gamma subunit [hydrothermal vent metagenome]|uniref:Pyruvate:ferredoxin oxidoreductase, gamma subunit n=1 Tax=hydrothermal vent metagenome TaxID=652676 RepID=A0A3B1DR01_9ZZZZ